MVGITKHKKVRSLILHTTEEQPIKTSIQSQTDDLGKIIYGNIISED